MNGRSAGEVSVNDKIAQRMVAQWMANELSAQLEAWRCMRDHLQALQSMTGQLGV